MNIHSPVYTTDNTCQDCYKCIRHCPCRAIRIDNGRAGVIQELCVACGMCVRVCPAKAKKIRPDLPRVKYILSSGKKVYASLAPSFASYFKDCEPTGLAAGICQLGFAGVSETALGAQMVSAETAAFLDRAKSGVYFSGACPAAVDYVKKYAPNHVKNIVPVLSPLLSHAKLLRRTYGDDIGVVFFGPCVAKKNEADRHPELLDLAVSFNDLDQLFLAENIKPEKIERQNHVTMLPQNADEGKIYAVEGGMNYTLRGTKNDVHFVTVSGLRNLERLFRDVPDAAQIGSCKIFVECLACYGGCVNGPVMPVEYAGTLTSIVQIAKAYEGGNSLSRKFDIQIDERIFAEPPNEPAVTEQEIKLALTSVGKFVPADELNCGGCGYFTCREFAKALLANKAETEMCVSYLRQLAQRKSNALIKYIPAGVLIVDRHLRVVECNRRFAELFDEDTVLAFDACGLVDADVRLFVKFDDLIASVLENGGELQRYNQVYDDKILNISVFTISLHQSVGAIVQNVTSIELHREQVSEKARAVIQKNIITCQKIARNLGEHMAETEILLREIAGAYTEAGKGNKPPQNTNTNTNKNESHN
ncbi:MAG: 4Fe-4S binding protein [Planctomycetaceae bacterium]|jgi:iron only hydrogenase large subunit-like protein|nr:4Fe-4S binding protein [Planctomycetaceae bacterium]